MSNILQRLGYWLLSRWPPQFGWKGCERCGLPTPTVALNYTNTKDDRRMCPRCSILAEEDEERQREPSTRLGRGPRSRRHVLQHSAGDE